MRPKWTFAMRSRAIPRNLIPDRCLDARSRVAKDVDNGVEVGRRSKSLAKLPLELLRQEAKPGKMVCEVGVGLGGPSKCHCDLVCPGVYAIKYGFKHS
jgi:hypothetical protein